jgi:uncharacterized iron-regulated membrane protein
MNFSLKGRILRLSSESPALIHHAPLISHCNSEGRTAANLLMPHTRRTLRSWSATAHIWLGLTAGLLVCVLSISGAVIAFRPQIEDARGPKVASAQQCRGITDPDRAAQSVSAYAPGAHIERIVFPVDAEGYWRLQIADARHVVSRVAYDPCSAKVLGQINVRWLDWLVDLHHNLLAGKTGRLVVGAFGIALFLMSLSGLFVWVMSKPKWRRALRIQTTGSTRRVVFDLHRSVGLIAMVMILVQSSTGIWLAYPKALRAALGRLAPVDSARKVTTKKDKTKGHNGSPDISALLRAASEALPDGNLRELRLPDADAKSVQVKFWRVGDIRASGNNTVTVDTSKATVTSVERFSDLPPAQKLIEGITPIHYGEWGGIGYRILLSAAGLVPPALFVSGFLIWWLPKRGAAKRARVASSDRALALSHRRLAAKS